MHTPFISSHLIHAHTNAKHLQTHKCSSNGIREIVLRPKNSCSQEMVFSSNGDLRRLSAVFFLILHRYHCATAINTTYERVEFKRKRIYIYKFSFLFHYSCRGLILLLRFIVIYLSWLHLYIQIYKFSVLAYLQR